MKKTIVGLFAIAGAISALAQGTLTFENLISGTLKAPFYGPETPDQDVSKVGNTSAGLPPGTQVYTGSLLTGSNWKIQLLGAPGMVDQSALVGISPITSFRTGAAAGFIAPVTFVPGPLTGATVATFQVLVWDDSSGQLPTWDLGQWAWRSGLTLGGASPLYYAPPTGVTDFLQSFNVYHIPEPGILCLLALGVAAFGGRARR